jgi:hypothetical protein
MTTAKGPHRPVEDPKSLLTADGSERSSCTYRNTRQPACLQRLLYLYHAATATVLRLNIKVLWAFVPLGLAAAVFNMNSIVTSTFNFLAIIPLSVQVCRLSDKLSARSGDLLGALINAIFGNGVELIVILS